MATKLEDQIAEAENPDEPEGAPDEEEAPAAPDDADAEEEAADEPAAPDAEPDEAQASMELKVRELEGEHKRHLKALTRIMGENFAGYVDCPVCFAMGYVPGSPLSDDPNVRQCETCKGFGVVRTGAVNPETSTRQCPSCIGNGYVPTSDPAPPQFAVGTQNGAAMAVPMTPAKTAEVLALEEAGYIVIAPAPLTA